MTATATASLRRNVAANYFGQGWKALMGIVFVPLYIHYVGIEAYGLIGVFGVVQAWMGLLDIGMRPALTREMARFTSGAIDVQSLRDLLRSVEILAGSIAATAGIVLWASAGWIATEWLKLQELDVHVVTRAVALMGLLTALRFVETVYSGALSGLQRQVFENSVSSTLATLRSAGALGVLAWVSPTISAFFIWQVIVGLLSLIVLGTATHRILPSPPRRARFSREALRGIWRFAAGMMFITLLSLLLTQVDKVLLSRLLTLRTFGYYTLASTVANALAMLAAPIASAYYPRFIELFAANDEGLLRHVYHQASQLITVCAGAATIVLIIYGRLVLKVWTSNEDLASHAAPLLAVLALGGMLNILMWAPFHLQLAHGWTSLTVKVNTVAVAILVPAILVLVPRYGAISAAWVWVALNAGYLVSSVPLMHRRILSSEMWRWYGQDVLMPLAAGAAVALACRPLLPQTLSRGVAFGAIIVVSTLVMSATALSAPYVRHQVFRHLRPLFARS